MTKNTKNLYPSTSRIFTNFQCSFYLFKFTLTKCYATEATYLFIANHIWFLKCQNITHLKNHYINNCNYRRKQQMLTNTLLL
uniref:Uncharacterized protein n=1 Tax=Anguilla anguilla TaxID=7936 RepID=A0A0E9X5Y1_ANGAN